MKVGSLPSGIVAAELTGDGKLDLAVTLAGEGKLQSLTGNGDGSFVAGYVATGLTKPRALAVADFDADGKQDLAVTGGNSVTVFLSLPALLRHKRRWWSVRMPTQCLPPT